MLEILENGNFILDDNEISPPPEICDQSNLGVTNRFRKCKGFKACNANCERVTITFDEIRETYEIKKIVRIKLCCGRNIMYDLNFFLIKEN